jgi:hypothetical protein
MKTWLWLCLASLAWMPTSSIAQGASPVVGGIPVHCVDSTGATVYSIYNPSISDVAMSMIAPNNMRLIVLNPARLTNFPPLLQLFAYAHECGHHMSGDIVAGAYFHHDNLAREQNADRIGIRLLRDQLSISLVQAQALASSFSANPAVPPYYLPGPMRAQWIVSCYETQDDACSRPGFRYARDGSGGANVSDDGDDNSEEGGKEASGDFCTVLAQAVKLSPVGFSSVRGARDGAGGWDTSLALPNASSCSLQSDDDTHAVNYYCAFRKGNIGDLKSRVQSCLSDWSMRSHHGSDGGEHLKFRNQPGSTEVELWERSTSGVSLSVEENTN